MPWENNFQSLKEAFPDLTHDLIVPKIKLKLIACTLHSAFIFKCQEEKNIKLIKKFLDLYAEQFRRRKMDNGDVEKGRK